MVNINNWTELINSISERSDGVFPKLLLRVNQFLRICQKSDINFDPTIVKKNHMDIFNNFILVYEQLQIEDDITDIFVEIPSLTSMNSIQFNMIGIGKWIKIYGGDASKIFFFDDEKTIISDKSIAEFLNKIGDIRSKYLYFGNHPKVYYKFKTMPSSDTIKYLNIFGVISLDFSQKTSAFNYPKVFDEKVLLDQSIIITLCSNLSFGLSESYYQQTKNITKDTIVKNRVDLEEYIKGKKILVNENVYKQVKQKINNMGGPLEKERFNNLCNKIIIVPDKKNPRFYFLKDTELICISVAEREHAVMVTNNKRLINKLEKYYQEIPYKLFYGAQLSELKYT